MKMIVEHAKYGRIVYEENFWNGRRDITVGDIYLRHKSKNIFLGDVGDECVEFEVVGNYAAGVKIKLDGEYVEIVPKTKWYEYLIYFLPFILVMIWGNNQALCEILPVIGGLIGGAISAGVSFAALIQGKKSSKILHKLICALVGLIVGFGICAGIGLLLVG